VPDESRITLDYHKNTAIHFFVPDALFATGLLTMPGGAKVAVRERTLALSRLFKHEFIYASGKFDDLFEQRLRHWVAWGLVTEQDGTLTPTAQGKARLSLLAAMTVPFVEGYAAAAEALDLLASGPADAKAFVKAAMERSRAAFLAGRLRRAESRSKVMLENALALFEEQGLVVRAGDRGKLRALNAAWTAAEARHGKVAEIRSFVVDATP